MKTEKVTFGMRLKRHRFFTVFSLGSLLWVTGFFLLDNTNLITLSSSLTTANSLPLLLWRMAFYSTLILCWKPLIVRLSLPYNVSDKKMALSLTYRRKLIIAIVLFEVLVVQNLAGFLLHWLWSIFYGR